MSSYLLSHLQQLENESIHIIREVAAECHNPVMLYSIGKDSGVMLRLAQKAFAPAPIPFPLLHVNTTFKFKEMIQFRDQLCKDIGVELIEWINKEGVAQNANLGYFFPYPPAYGFENLFVVDNEEFRTCSRCFMTCSKESIFATYLRGAKCLRELQPARVAEAIHGHLISDRVAV